MEMAAEYQNVIDALLTIRDSIRRGKFRFADLENALITDLLEVAFFSDKELREKYLSEYVHFKTERDTEREISYLDDVIANIKRLAAQQTAQEQKISAMQNAQASVLPKELRRLEESPSEYRLVDTNRIFLAQNPKEQALCYQRMDVIIKYLAIENYYHKNNYGFVLYQKLQSLRQRQSGGLPRDYEKMCVKVFSTLISSIETEHFKEDSYITCDGSLVLIDGAHRLAAGLYFNIPKIRARIFQVNVCMRSPFTADYLRAGGFTEEELALICGKAEELLEMCRRKDVTE